jgi:hypothetical protein
MDISQAKNHSEYTDYRDLVLFTSTFYTQDQESINRSQLALDLVRNAHVLGVRLVVADSSPLLEWESMSSFEKSVHALIGDTSTVIVMRTHKRLAWGTQSTMADERKQALEYGLESYPDSDHFLWIEPEKANLVTQQSLSTIAKTAQETAADFVIPTRAKLAYVLNQNGKKMPDTSLWGINTLPEFQARTETRANTVLRKDTGEYHDSYFGPVLLKRWTWTEQYLNSPHPTWGVNVLTPIEWRKNWLSVVAAPIDYSYDDRQRLFENGDIDGEGNQLSPEEKRQQAKKYKKKRVKQYQTIVTDKNNI